MTKDSLVFRRLSILRMPGLPRGIHDFIDFAPHINIIYGPNASGKSSTARTILNLIWRQETGDIIANALIDAEGEAWEFKLDGKKAVTRRNGRDDILNGIPAREGMSRYSLALHELIEAADGDLAQQVIKDSTGYDLDAAQRTFGYGYGAYDAKKSIYREYAAANGFYKKIFELQDELKREQEMLGRLLEEKKNAEQAAKLVLWYSQLREFAEAKSSLERAMELQSLMPPVLDSLNGQEYGDALSTSGSIDDLNNEIGKFERNIADAQKRQSAVNFPVHGLPENVTDELEIRINDLGELESNIDAITQEIAKALSREHTALKTIDPLQDVSEWPGLTWRDLELTDEHLQKAHRLQSRRSALEELIAGLQRSVPGSPKSNPGILMMAIRILSDWLQDAKPNQTKSFPGWSLWLVAILAIVPAIFFWAFGNIGLLAIIIPIVAAIAIYYLTRRTGPAAQDIRQGDYEKTGLPLPNKWNAESVREQLDKIVEQLGIARWEQHVLKSVKIYQEDLVSLQPQADEINQRYNELKNQLVLIPKAPSDELKSFDGMYWFLIHCREWHKNFLERKALEDGLATLVAKRNLELQTINKSLTNMNVDAAADASSARAMMRRLKEKGRIWQEAAREIENAGNSIDDLRLRINQLASKLNGIYTITGVESGMIDELKDLVSQLPTYQKIKQETQQLSTVLEERGRGLRAHPLFADLSNELEGVPLETINEKIKAYENQSENVEDIKTQINTIYVKMQQAESGNDLERALKTKDDCLSALEKLYDENLGLATGKLIVDALKKQADDRDRPPVFRRANDLFTRITNGKYQLRLNSGDQPAFGAFDTVEGEWRNLDELSTGTRIQLLLSVRLAFIDSVETIMRIPVLADELLANSDQQRAAAIVDALVEISGEGRQIFYFTSKEEEVAKWEELLAEKSGISGKIFVLSGRDNQAYEMGRRLVDPEFTSSSLIMEVPEINNIEHGQFGRLLNVGKFDIMSDQPDRLHIWYLFEDTHVVRSILLKGIKHLGQLRTFISHGGSLDLVNEEMMRQVGAKIAVFERFQLLYRKGRPRQINRIVLENSDAITDSFIDAVCQKSQELDNDPVRLLDSLANNGVPRFRAASLDRLRDYLLTEGYISDEEVLSAENIWISLSAYISNLPIKPEDAQRFIDRILSE